MPRGFGGTPIPTHDRPAGALGFTKGGGFSAVTRFNDFGADFDAERDQGGSVKANGDTRRSQKVVSYRGPENTANNVGDATVVFYCRGTGFHPLGLGSAGVSPASSRWRLCEIRDRSNHTTFQDCWGLGGLGVSPGNYVDELLRLWKNVDPPALPDVVDRGGCEQPLLHRAVNRLMGTCLHPALLKRSGTRKDHPGSSRAAGRYGVRIDELELYIPQRREADDDT